MCKMMTSNIIPSFHEYTIWLPINIIGSASDWLQQIFNFQHGISALVP